MKNLIILIIVVATGLFLTKPSDADFNAYAEQYIENRISKNKKNTSKIESVLSGIVAEIGGKLIAEVTQKKDYYLFTIYEVKLDKEEPYKFVGIAKNFLPLQAEEPLKEN